MMRAIFLAGLVAVGWIGAVEAAAYTVTLDQVGTDIIAAGSGSFDTTSLDVSYGSGVALTSITPSVGQISVGAIGRVKVYNIFANTPFPTKFGDGTVNVYDLFGIAVFGSGPIVSIYALNDALRGALALDVNYISGTAFSNSATFKDFTFETLGVSAGTYVFSFSDNVLSLIIGTTVPEPASLALLALPIGMTGLIAARRRRARQ